MNFSVFQKNQDFGYSWSTLLWYQCYYLHQLGDALSPACGIFSNNFFFTILIYFHLKNLPGKQSHSELHAFSLHIFNIKIRCSWILWKIFVNKNNISQITIIANTNNIHKMKLWQIGIGIYSLAEYQRIDMWRIYLQTICKLFANKQLFTEHWSKFMLCPCMYVGIFSPLFM